MEKKNNNTWIIAGVVGFLLIFIAPVVILAGWTILSILFSILAG